MAASIEADPFADVPDPVPNVTLGRRLREAVPFGILVAEKPRHFREMLKVVWENRDNAGYAWRILNRGVCDGCSLGPYGLKDNVMDGTHLCLTRLKLLRFNTMPAMPDGAWEDGNRLRGMTNTELQELGRVPYPLLMRTGPDGAASGFKRISWDEALELASSALNNTPPDRQGFFVTSRGITNEPYFVIQKLARAAGSNNVDLCSRLCHAPSVTGLKETLGYGAPTISLSDFIGTDLLVLFGTDLANNQPVTTKYMHYAKQAGTKIIVVNPVREPGLEKYWIPSVASSAVFGTKIMDEFYQVRAGGDIAFIHGVIKVLIAKGLVDAAFIRDHTNDWDALREHVEGMQWSEIEAGSGLPRGHIERFADIYGEAKSAVLCYSMGLTQHRFGADNVRAIVNLALTRGNVGREKAGIMPIRGHSGVQGGGECGVDPVTLPGGFALTAENLATFSKRWGFEVPSKPGMRTGELMARAFDGELDLLYNLGGNLHHTMPDMEAAAAASTNVRFRIHQDIVLNTSTVMPAKEWVLVLPAETRYEQRTGGTTTSTERRIRFTPEIPGPRIGEAKPEWEIPALIGQRLTRPGAAASFAYPDTQTIRNEIADLMPIYKGVETLTKEGDFIQWGGPTLYAGAQFNTPDSRARFKVVQIPDTRIPDGMFHLATRRGKQFNSIILNKRDPQMGGMGRDTVFLGAPDAASLGVGNGDRIRLHNDHGEVTGTVHVTELPRRHLQMYWPESNVLIEACYDNDSGVPDYNAFVRIEKM